MDSYQVKQGTMDSGKVVCVAYSDLQHYYPVWPYKVGHGYMISLKNKPEV